jgi:hypothetical protein
MKQYYKKVLLWHKKGLINSQIAKKLNLTNKQVIHVINRANKKSNKYRRTRLTNELKQFLIGSLLGDGCIPKLGKHARHCRFSVAHSLKQKEYCKWKHSILDKYSLAGKIYYTTYTNNRYINNIEEIRFKSISHPYFSFFRRIFYINNVKIVPNIIKEIDNLGLAIWYMDDGNKTKYGYELNTQLFTKDDCNFLRKILLDKFNINTTYVKSGVIYIKSESRETFTNLIKPFTIDSMLYKLHMGPV